jgi:hypothetical protein
MEAAVAMASLDAAAALKAESFVELGGANVTVDVGIGGAVCAGESGDACTRSTSPLALDDVGAAGSVGSVE